MKFKLKKIMKLINILLLILSLGLLSCVPKVEKTSTIETTKVYKNIPIFDVLESVEDDVITSDTLYWFVSHEVAGKNSGNDKGSHMYTVRFAGFFILKSTKNYFSIDEAIKYLDRKYENMSYRGVTFFKQVDRRCYLEWKNAKTY